MSHDTVSIESSVHVGTEGIRRPDPSVSNIDRLDDIQVAKDYYSSNGFIVLDGHDFELNLLVHLSPENDLDRKLLNDYVRTTIRETGKTPKITDYARNVLDILGAERTCILLHVFRMFRFMGGSKFPDMVLVDRRNRKILMRHLKSNRFPPEQKMFIFLAQNLLKLCDIKLADVSGGQETGGLSFTIEDILKEVMNTEKASRFMRGLDEVRSRIKEETGKVISSRKEHSDRVFMHEDEIYYLNSLRYIAPFPIFNSWLEERYLSGSDIINNMKKLQDMTNKKYTDFRRFFKLLQADYYFLKLLPFKDPESLRKKKEHLQEKFGLGESRTRDLLIVMSTGY
jgi:hypothetical protein